jgi:hypothetical protein
MDTKNRFYEHLQHIRESMASSYLQKKRERDYDVSDDGKSFKRKKSMTLKDADKDAKNTVRALKRVERDKYEGRLERLRGAKKRSKEREQAEQINELKGSTARSAEHKAAERYYNDYDDETAARRKALKAKTPESRDDAEKAKSKRMKSADRVIRFQNYANKKKKEEKKLDEGKWDYPKHITRTRETSDMGTTNAAANRARRKAFRKKVKAKAHKELMSGGQKSSVNPDK